MSTALTPDRRLESTPGRDDDGHPITLWRTEFWQGPEMVDATPWTPHPRQAISDGDEAERPAAELPDYLPSWRQAQRKFITAA